ncbi:MAG: desulfoferrodoxin, partial [Candidatus Delongbacteria bacterium]|nr:desulfoferrodoxin [Candidatus Delongbacteria bacterium]
EEKHYIEWIEVINGTYSQKKYLKPGDKPQAEFYVPYSDKLIVKSYCNLHGLWKNK